MRWDALVECVRANLTPDLLRKEYRGGVGVAGHCYVASEALYHLLDRKMKPMQISHEGKSHWYLVDVSGIVCDATADQFTTPVPYEKGRGKGFLTRNPSKRALELMKRVRSHDQK